VSFALQRDRPACAPAEIAPTHAEICHVLSGHSGASVVLHSSGSRNFVRKTAASPALNGRLNGQIQKQRSLCRTGIPFPRILMTGTDKADRIFFDMAYVPGRTIGDAVASASAFDPQAVLAAVERMLWLFRACRGIAVPGLQFREKIAAIRDHFCTHVPAKSGQWEAVHACASRLALSDWEDIPRSLCHGDLTLENIMLTADREIVFIDCDETWVSSYWLDAAKLFQDFDGHWCLRDLYARADTSIQLANAIEKLERLAAPFRALIEEQEPALAARLPQLAALNLFRALPYATETRVASFICERVLRLLDR
jgi:aminoglycoside phosphotransferase